MKAIEAKGLFAVLASVGGYLLNCLSEIIIILAVLMVIDFILGVSEALLDGGWKKGKGIRGVVKKIGYIVCVASGFLLDYVILWLAEKAGVNFSTGGFFGIAVTCYLIGTEGLSIFGHLVALGVPVPPFLKKGFGKLMDTSETLSGEGNDKTEEDVK